MQIEVKLEYPRHLYRVPGSKNGSGFLPGYTYDDLLVGTEDEAKVAMGEGFYLTPPDALEAHLTAPAVESEAQAPRRGRPPKTDE